MNAIKFYRLANLLYNYRIPIIPSIIRRIIFIIFNSEIPPECKIGVGSYFAHGGIGVVLNPDCIIGERVCIGQNVTIGGSFGSKSPIIGSDVWVSPGVRILGSVRVGNNVILGANAVVVKDIPDNCIATGIPAQVQRTLFAKSLNTLQGSIIE